ncbi:unnamed protein product [Cylindrotheca closterium]|uniref:Uncharacterized protein n=1 Tax=Cylindrotheca closterium TaxID=2856 RepID=A0AAD2FMU8_9STRA|nr:unnamed protein product [Cylindrotheca closterium]
MSDLLLIKDETGIIAASGNNNNDNVTSTNNKLPETRPIITDDAPIIIIRSSSNSALNRLQVENSNSMEPNSQDTSENFLEFIIDESAIIQQAPDGTMIDSSAIRTTDINANTTYSDPTNEPSRGDYCTNNNTAEAMIAERYRREFEDLLERDERGDPIDEVRLYFLELYARRMVGEQLTEDEMRDLEEFEKEEHRHQILSLSLLGTPIDDVDTLHKTENDREEKERHHEAAGELLEELNARTDDMSAKSLMQQILEDDLNSLVSAQPLATAKKMKSNSNIYEIDPPCRLENLKLFDAAKAKSVLRDVDASLYRLKQGAALNTKNIRQDEYYAKKRNIHKFPLKLEGATTTTTTTTAISNSGNLVSNPNGLPGRRHRPTLSDPRVLIAHAGTKLHSIGKSNRQCRPAKDGRGAHHYASRRIPRNSRRNVQTSSVITAAAGGGPRTNVSSLRKFQNREVERVTGAYSSRQQQIGVQANNTRSTTTSSGGLNRKKQARNRNGLLRQHDRKSQSQPAYLSNRRQLPHVVISNHQAGAGRNPIEQLTAIHPRTNRTRRESSNGQQEPAGIPSSENYSSQLLGSKKSTQPAAQKSTQLSNRHAPQEERVADRSLHLLSQMNQVENVSVRKPATFDSLPAATAATSLQKSKAISILQQTGGNLSTNHRKIHSSIRNERFLMATDLAYDRIVKENHRLELLFSIAEWRHVHALMLYARIFQCELSAENIFQPKEFSIYVPDNLHIFEPLGVVLASIGVVEEKEGGLSYIPVAKPLHGGNYKPHDPSDVTVFMEWSQYKWNDSWTQAKVERTRRKNDAQSRGINIPENEKKSPNHLSRLECWEHLALEMWLGWDEELWFSYELFVESVSRSFLFVDFPRSPAGTYAWLIPSFRSGSGSYAKIPNPTIGNAVWMISLLFDLSDLPPQDTASWFCKTDAISDIQATLLQFLDSAAKE